jgi:hypothetical protein
MIAFVPFCGLAAWWQITRATGGNGLSYLYAVEWPIFAILGVYFWWMLVHTDYDQVGLRGMRLRATQNESPLPVDLAVPAETDRDWSGEEDPELAAYNARLAALGERGAKTWRHTEAVVARRPQ